MMRRSPAVDAVPLTPRFAFLFPLLIALSMAFPARAAVLRVDAASVSTTPDGTSWATAYSKVAAALSVAGPGDEVWVAAGQYAEALTLTDGVALYGGFAGTETARSERSPLRSHSILSGTQQAVTAPAGVTGSAVLDGFVVRNTTGAVLCDGSSPTIRNNFFYSNGSSEDTLRAGGITCRAGAAPRIEGNRFIYNDAVNGGAIVVDSASPVVVNNTVLNSRNYSDPNGNPGQGSVFVIGASSAPLFANNIFAGGSALHVSGGSPVFRNNCFYNTSGGAYEVTGITSPVGQDGNIWAEPRLAHQSHLDLHIQPDSPCLDTGDNSAVAAGATDMDGQPRIQGSSVDIGADESDGTTWPVETWTLHVRTDGSNLNDGLTWGTAKRTVTEALRLTNAGDEIWVAAGEYKYTTGTVKGAGLYGGFAGTETQREDRNARANATVLEGYTSGTMLTLVGDGAVDGFTLRGAKSPYPWTVGYSSAISCPTGTGRIENNTITGFTQGAIYVTGGTYLIRNNRLTGNSNRYGGGAISLRNGGNAVVAGNTFLGNAATSSTTAYGQGGALYADGTSQPDILNNTFAANSASRDGGAVFAGTASMVNNILAGNGSGAHLGTGSSLRHNIFFQNGAYHAKGIESPIGANGNTEADPRLADPARGDLHIQPDSPARDAGDGSVVGPGATDIDGQARIQGAAVDIGADESDGTTWPALGPRIIRVSTTGDDAHDGASWAGAMKTVGAALAAAAPGGEVWVAAGTYQENLLLGLFTGLYGGFAGTETAREERDPAANATTLDGGRRGTVITARSVLGGAVDGFTIRRGAAYNNALAAGMQCEGSRVRVTNNLFTANDGPGIASVYGDASSFVGNTVAGNIYYAASGAIHVYNATPLIEGNVIRENATGRPAIQSVGPTGSAGPVIRGNTITKTPGTSGVAAITAQAATVTGNLIVNNATSAILIPGQGTVAGNTIVKNAGGVTMGAEVLFANNIYAYNTGGITAPSGLKVRRNALHGNGYTYVNFSYAPGMDPNLLADPRLASIGTGNFHIQPDSPCVDAGDDTLAEAGATDMDGQARILGAHVDIGADESDGTVWPGFILRVSPSGDDANDGSEWAKAKRTIQAAIDVVAVAGGPGEIWVAGGTYAGSITLKPFADLYGGFAGTETARTERLPGRSETILDGNKSGAVVSAGNGANVVFDGFTVQNGGGNNGGGLTTNNASPVIRNCVIRDNTATFSGGGLYCNNGAPVVEGTTFFGNKARQGGAMYIWGTNAPPRIANNRFLYNTAVSTSTSTSYPASGGAIHDSSSGTVVTGNLFLGNQAIRQSGYATPYSLGGAIYGTAGTVANNTFTANKADRGGAAYAIDAMTLASNIFTGNQAAMGGAVYAEGPALIANNTLVQSASAYGAIYAGRATPRVVNNLVAYNAAGIGAATGVAVTVQNNDVSGNTGAAYVGLADPTGTNGNIALDPKLASLENGDVHIQPDSPCRDAGNGTPLPAGSTDMDGQPRVQGAAVDIGADESDGTTWIITPRVVRVSPSGDDAHDGATWATAKRTIRGGLDALAPGGGEVWVAEGEYAELVVLRSFARLYGGFAGAETAREERDPARRLSIIDAQGNGSPVSANGAGYAAVDGFAIRGGSNSGVNLTASSVRIANNLISGNVSSGASNPANAAGGILVNGGAPVIENNRVIDNTGVGITSTVSADPRIVGNVVAGNNHGLVCLGKATVLHNTVVGNADNGVEFQSGVYLPTVVNNIVAFNGTGLYARTTAATVPTVHHNAVYGNTRNYAGLIAQSGDIQADPLLAGMEHGNFHIQPGSPAIEAGDTTLVEAGATDMDGQPRVQGAAADIGADESDGTAWTYSPRIMRVGPFGDDTRDGSGWAEAKRSVQAALDALAATGGEVWVAQGTYDECLALPAYTRLYGGFAGTETDLAQRDWAANATVLDGGKRGSVVHIPAGSTRCVVDGFTIRNGQGVLGGGLFIESGASEIAHNIVTGNHATGEERTTSTGFKYTVPGHGGGLYAARAGNVHDNLFRSNRAMVNGAGAYVPAGVTQGSGAFPAPSLFTNNTVVENVSDEPAAGGLWAGSDAVAANNIVAFNSGGISGTTTVVLKNNNVHGNGNDYINVPNPLGADGNIQAYPGFADRAAGDFRLRATSPSVDAGSDAHVAAGALDLDGHARIRGLSADMGAYESAGPRVVPAMARVYVRPIGSDDNDGGAWAAAKRTIGSALAAVQVPGGEVWVAAGTYPESVVLPAGVGLYGGFTGTEADRASADPVANVTVIPPAGGSAVLVMPGAGNATVLDGFTLSNGRGTPARRGAGSTIYLLGGGLYARGASPAIRRCVVTGGTADFGAGIYLSGGSTALLEGNVIRTNVAKSLGGGLYADASSPVATSNTFAENHAVRGAGAYIIGGTSTVTGNTFEGNLNDYEGSGVYLENADARVVRNRFVGNVGHSAVSAGGGSLVFRDNLLLGTTEIMPVKAYTAGLGLYGINATVVNNTFAGSVTSALTSSGGSSSPAVAIANNIFAMNRGGIDLGQGYASLTVRDNCFWSNGTPVDSRIVSGTDGNIADDPRFVNVAAGDLHIQPDSPCHDSGDDSLVEAVTTDMDGQARVQGTHVDMGADESDGVTRPGDPKVVYVRPDGDDANDGSSWAKAKRTIAAATGTLTTGREVWVAAGTYTDVVITGAYNRLYGGFAGIETARDQRDPAAHPTVITAGGEDINQTAHPSTEVLDDAIGVVVDGFGIRDGGGIHVGRRAAVTVSHNTIEDNAGAAVLFEADASVTVDRNILRNNHQGVATSLYPVLKGNAVTTVTHNTILGNRDNGLYINSATVAARNNVIAANGNPFRGWTSAGVFATNTGLTLANNTIAANSGEEGAGLYLDRSEATVVNNILAFNTSGIYVSTDAPTSAVFASNCLWGNAAYNARNADAALAGTNLVADPALADITAGAFHIRPASPCRDAGKITVVVTGEVDMDGQPRVQGAGVDIGADESDGTDYAPGPRIVRVRPDGSDANDGASWAAAKRTVQAALDAGGEVWVASGTYEGSLVMGPFSTLYGGFAGTETARSQRRAGANASALVGGGVAPVVAARGGGLPSVVDGFTLRNRGTGTAISAEAGDFRITGNTFREAPEGITATFSTVDIANNDIDLSTANGVNRVGIDARGSGVVAHNRVKGPGGGIKVAGQFTVRSNRVTGHSGTGIAIAGPGQVLNNVVMDGRSDGAAYGISVSGEQVTVKNNVVANNQAKTGTAGILLQYPQGVLIANNTIVNNRSETTYSGAIDIINWGTATIANNLIAFNRQGITVMNDPPLLQTNGFFGNTDGDYIVHFQPTSAYGSITSDPKLVDYLNGDVHLRAGSPCINAGALGWVQAGDTDMDGQPRDPAQRPDVGADEYGLVAALSAADALRIGGGLKALPSGAGPVAPVDVRRAVELARQATGLAP